MDWIYEVLNLRPHFDKKVERFQRGMDLYRKEKAKRDPSLPYDNYLEYLYDKAIEAGWGIYYVFGKYCAFIDVDEIIKIGREDTFEYADRLWWNIVSKICLAKSQGRF